MNLTQNTTTYLFSLTQFDSQYLPENYKILQRYTSTFGGCLECLHLND